jgi:hypothetical protein
MKASDGSWVRVSLFVLLPMLAVLVIGVALLVGLLLGRAFDQSFEPAPTTWPTPDAALATATVTSPAEPTPVNAAPTRTPHPTMEPQATESSLPESTPEPTRHSTNTPDPTPSQSHTPSVRIRTFTASPSPIERGGTVTLTWDAPGAESAGITRLSPEGDIFLATEALDLPARGSIDLQVPDDYVISVKYYLGARDADGVLAKAYVTVGVICSYKEYVAPRCPLTQDHLWAAYEPFEHGHMIWRSDSREIYVLYDDGGYETYTDTWQEGDPVDVSGTPPTGMYAPVRGFGNLYANQPEIRGRLGWATDPEVGYTMWVETIPGGSGRYPGISTYFTLPDGSVVNLYPFTSTWKRMP